MTIIIGVDTLRSVPHVLKVATQKHTYSENVNSAAVHALYCQCNLVVEWQGLLRKVAHNVVPPIRSPVVAREEPEDHRSVSFYDIVSSQSICKGHQKRTCFASFRNLGNCL